MSVHIRNEIYVYAFFFFSYYNPRCETLRLSHLPMRPSAPLDPVSPLKWISECLEDPIPILNITEGKINT